MIELLGGERVSIVDGDTKVQTFERTMSEKRQRQLEADPDAYNIIDVWRLVTRMSARQKRKRDPVPPLDFSAPLDRQVDQIWGSVEEIKQRERATARGRRVKATRRVSDDTVAERYELGHGIPPVGVFVLWGILDGLARNRTKKIDAAELAWLITARR